MAPDTTLTPGNPGLGSPFTVHGVTTFPAGQHGGYAFAYRFIWIAATRHGAAAFVVRCRAATRLPHAALPLTVWFLRLWLTHCYGFSWFWFGRLRDAVAVTRRCAYTDYLDWICSGTTDWFGPVTRQHRMRFVARLYTPHRSGWRPYAADGSTQHARSCVLRAGIHLLHLWFLTFAA